MTGATRRRAQEAQRRRSHRRGLGTYLDRIWVPEKERPVPYAPSIAKVANVKKALASLPSLLVDVDVEPPCWLGEIEKKAGRSTVVCPNGVMDLKHDTFEPLSPELFATNALDTEWSTNPATPSEWLHFLHDLWPDDDEAISLLQEWFGYCLTADTSQQKMLWLIGPRRSGKGTISNVLRELIGRRYIAAPTLSSLAGSFGLEPLLGKSLAIIGDARLSARVDQAVIVEHLLSLIGEDAITVNRKNKRTVTTKPGARVIVMSNELPRLQDSALALAGRVLLLTMTRSFYGREDVGLSRRLVGELPGILRWAIEGWMRLDARGHFVVPASSKEELDNFAELSSPISAFLCECCDVGGTDDWESKDRLYSVYVDWCTREGTKPRSKAIAMRDIKGVDASIREYFPKLNDGSRLRALRGLVLKKLTLADGGGSG